MTESGPLGELSRALQQFADERDWNQFHSPKNLAIALSVEVAELLEHFQWVTQANSYELQESTREQVQQEMGDVLIYLVRLGDQLNIDVLDAAQKKLALNTQKYPANIVRGQSKKYTEYVDTEYDDTENSGTEYDDTESDDE